MTLLTRAGRREAGGCRSPWPSENSVNGLGGLPLDGAVDRRRRHPEQLRLLGLVVLVLLVQRQQVMSLQDRESRLLAHSRLFARVTAMPSRMRIRKRWKSNSTSMLSALNSSRPIGPVGSSTSFPALREQARSYGTCSCINPHLASGVKKSREPDPPGQYHHGPHETADTSVTMLDQPASHIHNEGPK